MSTTPNVVRFVNGDDSLYNVDGARIALVKYQLMRALGYSHERAEMSASNLLQRRGYRVSRRAGVTNEAAASEQQRPARNRQDRASVEQALTAWAYRKR